MQIEDAIDAAVQHCISCNVLKDFLIAHRAEVLSVCLTEFNEKVFVKSIREEGVELGELSMLLKLVKKERLSVEEALTECKLTKEEFLKLLDSEENGFGE